MSQAARSRHEAGEHLTRPSADCHSGREIGRASEPHDLMGAIVDLTDILIMVCDCQYGVLAVNRAHADEFERLYGVRPKVGDKLLDLLADQPDHQAQVRSGWASALAGEEMTFTEEYGQAGRASGQYEIKFRNLRSPDGELIGAYQFATEISGRLQQDAAFAATGDALRQSQKIEAIGQLTGGVAHDFNNLLTILRSSIDFLRQPDLSEARRRRYIDAASDTVDRATRLTGQLLAFARRQALTPVVFDVAEKVRETLQMFGTVAGARIRVDVDLPDAPCLVSADIGQFETALINLVANARDAMSGEGRLTLKVVAVEALPPIRGHSGSPGAYAALSLTDSGAGISADLLPRIFEPFFTTKGLGKGTGLGLSQVFGFAKQSCGDVDVTSTVGRGTTFTLYLPQAQGAVSTELVPEEAAAPRHGQGELVLVVEDNVDVGRFTTQLLEDLGYRTAWATSGEEALERLGRPAAAIDAVFSDLMMPGMDGLDFARAVRRELPSMPVVLTSGFGHALQAGEAAGFELLRKPYSAARLSSVLHAAITNGASIESFECR